MRHRVVENDAIEVPSSTTSTTAVRSSSAIVNLAKAIEDKLRNEEFFFSLEMFPCNRDDKENYYKRFFSDINECKPLFYALTWHENSGSNDTYLPLDVLKEFPCNTLLHVAANNLPRIEVEKILNEALAQGKSNIFALRGDNCTGTGEFIHAVDLVKFIRRRYGNKFTICVAGYPEMHPESESKESDMKYLKEKVDAGANIIITQIFFEAKVFVDFVKDCRRSGIKVPIIPGIFSIPSYRSLVRMAKLCSVKIPDWLMKDLELFKDDDERVGNYGTTLARKLIKKIWESGAASGFHLFTLNRVSTVLNVCRRPLLNK